MERPENKPASPSPTLEVAMPLPSEMTDDQLHTAFNRLSVQRENAGTVRKAVIVRVVDTVLDAWLDRGGMLNQ